MKGIKKFALALHEHGIHNNWELLKRFGDKTAVAVEYHRAPSGRIGMAMADKTSVWSPRRVHPKMEQKLIHSSFSLAFHGQRDESLAPALKWVKDNLGYEPVESPLGGYLPPDVVAKARALVEGK